MASAPDTCAPPQGPFTGGAEGKPCSGPVALESQALHGSGEGPMRTAQPGRVGEAEAPEQREPRPPPRSAGLGLPTNAPAPASANATLGKLRTGHSVLRRRARRVTAPAAASGRRVPNLFPSFLQGGPRRGSKSHPFRSPRLSPAPSPPQTKPSLRAALPRP